MTFRRLTDTLTSGDLAALRWAVREAAAWRGSIVGDPDKTNLNAFDTKIKKCQQALRAAKLTKEKWDNTNA